MINYDLDYKTYFKNYKFFTFSNILTFTALEKIKEEACKYPFTKLNGKRIDSNRRIWCHLEYDSFLQKLAKEFDLIKTKKFFSKICSCDFTQCKTRIELCNDLKGSFLESHTDDEAKLFTLQIYLTNINNTTILDGKSTLTKENNGWFFANTGVEYHSLPNLTSNRSSIIVNYVNYLWRDKSVLVN